MATVAYGIKENIINKSKITPSRKVKFDTRSKNLQKYRTENTYKSIRACMLTEFQKSLLKAGIYLAQNEPEVCLIRSCSGRKDGNMIARL